MSFTTFEFLAFLGGALGTTADFIFMVFVGAVEDLLAFDFGAFLAAALFEDVGFTVWAEEGFFALATTNLETGRLFAFTTAFGTFETLILTGPDAPFGWAKSPSLTPRFSAKLNCSLNRLLSS